MRDSRYSLIFDLWCIQAKKLTFLHVFHHATVVIMAWLWLHSAQSLQTIALLTNTFVHVVMYYYYYRSSIGSPPRWKKVVTNIQIVQFVFRWFSLKVENFRDHMSMHMMASTLNL